MNKVTSKSSTTDIRVYINNILHLRLQKMNNLRIQSWHDDVTKFYIIEYCTNKFTDRCEYEDKKLWMDVLKELDKLI